MFNGTLHVLENVETNVDIVSRLNELGVLLLVILLLLIIFMINRCYRKMGQDVNADRVSDFV